MKALKIRIRKLNSGISVGINESRRRDAQSIMQKWRLWALEVLLNLRTIFRNLKPVKRISWPIRLMF
ncbi:hypothetical protein CS542_03680 [Pedobacter sp. IW39]|nr:hypothetical protein CS542_03680 [Pedobacter sp. IW39]